MAIGNRTAVALQVSVFFHKYYLYLFGALALLLHIYKGIEFVYPTSTYGLEVALYIFFFFLEAGRLFATSFGNKSEQVTTLIVGLVLAIATVLCHVYFIRLQVYVLRVEVALNIIPLIFTSLEVLLGIVVAIRIAANP